MNLWWRQGEYRMKVWVGPGGVMYLVVMGLVFAAAVRLGSNLMWWTLGLMFGGLALSLAAVVSLRGVRVRRLQVGHAVVGQPLVLRYEITNPKYVWPLFNLLVREKWGRGRKTDGPAAEKPRRLGGVPQGWVLHLGPRQTVQAQAVCWPQRRGWLHLERVVLSTTFPLGVLRFSLEKMEPGRVLVYPRLYRLNRWVWRRMAALDPGGGTPVEQGGGLEEFFGLRRYHPGDSLRHIDWKHSAKAGELISREWTIPSPPRVMLALDLAHEPLGDDAPPRQITDHPGYAADQDDPIERAISLAASVICGAHQMGHQIGLTLVGVEGPSFGLHHSLPHRNHMLEALALLEERRRVAPVARPLTPPTMVVYVGAGTALTLPRGSGGPRRTLLMSTAQLEQFVLPDPQAATRLLAPPRATPPRRTRRREGAWT